MPSRRIEPFCVANQSHENFLGDVLGHGRVSAHMQGEPIDRRVPAPVEERESFLVAGNHPAHEAVICKFHGFCHILWTGPRVLSLHYSLSSSANSSPDVQPFRLRIPLAGLSQNCPKSRSRLDEFLVLDQPGKVQ